MLLQCKRCNTTYEVDDEILAEPGVVVECESCSVPLSMVEREAPPAASPPAATPTAPGPPTGDAESTMMLAAFDAEDIAKMRSDGPAAAPAAPARPARAARPAAPQSAAQVEAATRMVAALNEEDTLADATDVLGAMQDEAPAPTMPAPVPAPAPAPAPAAPAPAAPVPVAPAPAAPAPAPEALVPPPVERTVMGVAAQESPASGGLSEIARSMARDPGAAQPSGGGPDLKRTAAISPDQVEASRARREAREGAADEGEGQPSPSEEEAPAELPKWALYGVPSAVLLIFILTCYFIFKVASGETLSSSGEQAKAPKKIPFSNSMSLLMGRTDALLATAPTDDKPIESLPVLITGDELRFRAQSVLALRDGKLRSKDKKGLIIKPLLAALMRERWPAPPPQPEDEDDDPPPPKAQPLGRGSDTLLVMAESMVPYATVARVLYTAQSAGYERFLLGGPQEENPRAVGVFELKHLEWWQLGPQIPGRGIGVLADSNDGFAIYSRDGVPFETESGRQKVYKVAKGINFNTRKLRERLMDVKMQRPGTKRIVLQPDGRVEYEVLMGILGAMRGEDGDLYPKPSLGGGGLF